MLVKTNGIVLKQTQIGEKDKILTVLTDKYGLISVSARGSKGIKSKLLSACEVFAYSELVLYENKEKYVLNDADVINIFYPLRENLENLALGQYFLEIAYVICENEFETKEYLKLLLNSLYLICKKTKPLDLIKASFELRTMAHAGFMPNLVACRECNIFNEDNMYLDVKNANLVCGKCYKEQSMQNFGYIYRLSKSILAAIRHIVYSPSEKVFSFVLNENNLTYMSKIIEELFLYQTDTHFQSLDFYKMIKV